MNNRLQIPKMYKLFIGGKFIRTESERYFEVFDSTGKDKLCNVSRASRKDLRNAVEAAASGFSSWNGMTAYNRGQVIYRLSEMLEARKEQFIYEINLVTGKQKSQCKREVETAIDRIIFYAGLADKWMQLRGTINPVQSGYFNFSFPEATGIVGIIIPDNDTPLLTLVSLMIPVMIPGNSVVILSDIKKSLPVLSFGEVIATSDFPAASVNILTGNNEELYKHLAGHYDVKALLNADDTLDIKTLVELSANNLKRFKNISLGNIFDNKTYENPALVNVFSEVKTVWHTVGN